MEADVQILEPGGLLRELHRALVEVEADHGGDPERDLGNGGGERDADDGQAVERRQPDQERRAERQQDERAGHQRTAWKTMAMTAKLPAISSA